MMASLNLRKEPSLLEKWVPGSGSIFNREKMMSWAMGKCKPLFLMSIAHSGVSLYSNWGPRCAIANDEIELLDRLINE